MFKKILWGLSIVMLFGSIGFVTYQVVWKAEVVTSQEEVNRMYEFYHETWYDNWWEYDKDIDTLQRIKQQELDKLNYEDTIAYVQTQETQDEFVTLIDEVLKLAKEQKNMLEKPSYLNYWKDITETKTSTTLDFINLLK